MTTWRAAMKDRTSRTDCRAIDEVYRSTEIRQSRAQAVAAAKPNVPALTDALPQGDRMFWFRFCVISDAEVNAATAWPEGKLL